MPLAPTEEKMWEESLSENPIHKMTTAQIHDKYYRGESRIINQIGRETMANLLESHQRPRDINIMPIRIMPIREVWEDCC